MKLKVRCTFEIVIDAPNVENIEFMIEENSCPGSGPVGARLLEVIDEHDARGTCWACALQGENKIIEWIKDE